MKTDNEIAILDFGSQYTHLIARRIRELGVKSHIYPSDISLGKLDKAAGLILSGGPGSVTDQPKSAAVFDLNKPVLGLCYGHQLMANQLGGEVATGGSREYGLAGMDIKPSPIFKNINDSTTVWMSHGDHVAKLPGGFVEIASTDNGSITAMANENKKWYGFQFHPEVHHSQDGQQMLSNFVFGICQAKKNWDSAAMLAEIEAEIKQQADGKNIFLLVSGGVDSTVCFALLEKTLGKDRVYGLHVDHGLMRLNETKQITEALKKIGLDDLHVYDAEDRYLKALKNVIDPEEKRKIIGDLFLDITDEVMIEKGMCPSPLKGEAGKRSSVNDTNLPPTPSLKGGGDRNWLIGQGTIYPDTIESGGTARAEVIKTHHNRVPRIQEMITAGRIIEPIKDLYKDEVRMIGKKLGLPDELINRHPFPGPGLGIRCLCSDGSDEQVSVIASPEGAWQSPTTSEQTLALNSTGLLRRPDSIGTPRNDIYKLPLKSVGVQGDERTYAHPAVIVSENLDWANLRQISPKITNQHKDINRVLYLLDGATEQLQNSALKKADVNKPRLELLRKIDDIVNQNIQNQSHIWQMPVVLVPFGHSKGESIVLRPVESKEAMTVAFAEIDKACLYKILEEINKLDSIDFIFYDITNKPPGTIEWE